MTILSLLEGARQYPVFSLADCQQWFPRSQRATLILQLSQYVTRGHLIRLKRGLFALKIQPSPHPFVIASRLDPQSVVSLETVLHQSGMIPEVTFAVTAVTPTKTHQFHIPSMGSFLFRHIKPSLFFGWELKEYHPYTVRVACPEKALLDLFWFHRFEKDPVGYIHELRLSIPKKFSWEHFIEYSRQYVHPQLESLVRTLLQRYKKKTSV